MEVGEMPANYTYSTTIFSETGMFSASFNAKMNVLWWIMWFLHAGKELVCVRGSVVRVTKKWIWKPSSTYALKFVFGLKKTTKKPIALPKKVFRDKCRSNSSIKKWHIELKDDWKSVHNAPQCGRPRTLMIEINTDNMLLSLKMIKICPLEHWWASCTWL